MSNSLAIATVTASLSQILHEAVNKEISGAEVKTQRPDALNNGGQGTTGKGINVFLYQIIPNAALRNSNFPSRRADGTIIQRPMTAYNLHYILTFFGDESKLEPQRLLGIAVNAMDSRPLLTRDTILAAIDSAPDKSLADSNLAEQMEMVKLSPIALNLEELSKLWSVFFQTPYSLSVAYQCSVVILESNDMPKPALPIRRRSADGKTFRQPIIEKVTASGGILEPIIVGTTLYIIGVNLRGENTKVIINGVEIKSLMEVTEQRIVIILSPDMFPPDFLRAGILGVQVVHELGVESNLVPFILRPEIVGDMEVISGKGNTTTPAASQTAKRGKKRGPIP